MLTWIIIPITVLGTLMIGAGNAIFFYCKYKNTPNPSKALSIFWHNKNTKDIKAMLLGFLKQSVGYPNVKATPEKIKETLEMLAMDFSGFDKYKVCRNSKGGSKKLPLLCNEYIQKIVQISITVLSSYDIYYNYVI